MWNAAADTGSSRTRIAEETYMLRVYTLNPTAADRSWKHTRTERNWPLMSAEWQDACFARARCKGARGRDGPLRCGNSNFTLHRDRCRFACSRRYRKTGTEWRFRSARTTTSSFLKIHSSTQKISVHTRSRGVPSRECSAWAFKRTSPVHARDMPQLSISAGKVAPQREKVRHSLYRVAIAVGRMRQTKRFQRLVCCDAAYPTLGRDH